MKVRSKRDGKVYEAVNLRTHRQGNGPETLEEFSASRGTPIINDYQDGDGDYWLLGFGLAALLPAAAYPQGADDVEVVE